MVVVVVMMMTVTNIVPGTLQLLIHIIQASTIWSMIRSLHGRRNWNSERSPNLPTAFECPGIRLQSPDPTRVPPLTSALQYKLVL